MTFKKPIIGIILDWQESGSFSDFPHFALRIHYSEAIILGGGLPFMIPYSQTDLIDEYLQQIDGLLAPGGFYAMPNDWYINNQDVSPYDLTPRFEFESNILSKAIALNKPILGICGGMQVIAGLMGCKLIPDIKKYINSNIEHFGFAQDHKMIINDNTILKKIIGKNQIMINSDHNEAIIEVNNNVVISGQAIDGIIEAIELNDKDFVIGLQGHPENKSFKEELLCKSNPCHLIFQEFVKKSYEASNKKA
ncbi:gamma-glutamyl-gamma-aminobutyrate hydrolase family protein [Rickettsiales bacterium]|nr:gamma-glutamyl-gamma-aminobutyrate hydrolase family protein [Rickettsiales bacterium]